MSLIPQITDSLSCLQAGWESTESIDWISCDSRHWPSGIQVHSLIPLLVPRLSAQLPLALCQHRVLTSYQLSSREKNECRAYNVQKYDWNKEEHQPLLGLEIGLVQDICHLLIFIQRQTKANKQVPKRTLQLIPFCSRESVSYNAVCGIISVVIKQEQILFPSVKFRTTSW